jgi:eukaryotic-like serine/threonine-protein kinase
LSPASSPVSDEPRLTYSPGDVIAGKYALEEQLGAGGMGAVFRARNTLIDMPVAIKLIRADLDRDSLSGRLLQEARAAAKLSHAAIVRVFDVGMTALGDPFIVMELLSGETLAELIDREGRLSSARAVQLLLPIADALSMAHAKGFVHRDVKPDNVFLARDHDGRLQPKLVDFGIVKQEHPSTDSQLTQVGSVLGSPDYMSPEQARGLEHIDQRSDVWSFGVMLYEAVTGGTPFVSDSYNALLRLIVESEPVSLRDQSAADPELSAIVSKALSKEPAARFGSMGQMGKALASWLFDQGIGEDACGVSLDTKWLSRSTDPNAVVRASRSSFPDWLEAPSGVRTIDMKLGNAPTVEVAKSAGTPISLQAPADETKTSSRRRPLFLIAGAALVASLAAAVTWNLARREPPATATPPAVTVVAEEAPKPAVTAVTLAEVPPAPPPASQPISKPQAASTLSTALPAARALGSAAPRAAAPPTPAPAKPATDLLAPY